jgi:hypothetical protein
MSDLPQFQRQVQAVGRMLESIGYDAGDFEIKADSAVPPASRASTRPAATRPGPTP